MNSHYFYTTFRVTMGKMAILEILDFLDLLEHLDLKAYLDLVDSRDLL